MSTVQKSSREVDVSVLIVSYNALHHLRACLASLWEHDWGCLQWEVIVVDNGSSDGSLEYLESIADVKVIENGKNLGFAEANNIGARVASGRYLLLLNSDTILRPGAVKRMVNAAENDASVAIVGPRLLNPDLSLQSPCARALPSVWSVWVHQLFLDQLLPKSRWFGGLKHYWALRDQPTYVGSVSGAAMLINRRLYNAIGGLDTNFFMYYEDTDLCKRVWDMGKSVLYEPRSQIIHAWGGSTRNRVQAFVSTHKSLTLYFQKHHPNTVWLIQMGLAVGSLLRLGLWLALFPFTPSESRERLKMVVGVLNLLWGR